MRNDHIPRMQGFCIAMRRKLGCPQCRNNLGIFAIALHKGGSRGFNRLIKFGLLGWA
jgi:hypothetical protein